MAEFVWGHWYTNNRESESRLETVLSDIKKNVYDQRILDLGANNGFFSFGFANRGARVTAVEPPNEKDLFHPGVYESRRWVQCAAEVPGGPFDYALVLSVLHHMPRWKEILQRVLDTTWTAVYVEVPHPDEYHQDWNGSREQYRFLEGMPGASVIGSHFNTARSYKRDLWRVKL